MSEDQDTTPEDEAAEADHIKSLREKAKKADSVPALERKVAVLEAGINTSTPLGQMFLKSYDGELTPEAITEAASAVGLVEGQADPDPVAGEPGTAEAAHQEARSRLNQGDAAALDETPDNAPDKAFKAYNDARKRGTRTDDARVEGFKALIQEAARGNPTAIFDDRQFAQQIEANR